MIPHRDVFRVVRFLSVWGPGTTTLYWCLLLSSSHSMKMCSKLAYCTFAMSAAKDPRWILSGVLVRLTVFSFPKRDCKSLYDLLLCARIHWIRMSPKLLQWRIQRRGHGEAPSPLALVSRSFPPPPPAPLSEGLDLPLSCVASCKLPLETQYCQYSRTIFMLVSKPIQMRTFGVNAPLKYSIPLEFIIFFFQLNS